MDKPTARKRVVVDIDGVAGGFRVLDYAAHEALRLGAELLVVRCYRSYSTYSPMMPVYQPQVPREDAERGLREAVIHIRRQVGNGLTVCTLAREGSRMVLLPRIARDASVLVTARRRVRGPQRVVAAQSDLALAARTPCPVVVVPRNWKPSRADQTVAVGVDGTALSWEAVDYAFATAQQRAGRVVAVHASDPRRQPVAGRAESAAQAWLDSVELTVAETLAGWQERYPDVAVSRFFSSERVVDALLYEAAEAGLLVLGVHPDTNRLVGDPVARHIVAAATCPVALVRHQVTHTVRRRSRDGAVRPV